MDQPLNQPESEPTQPAENESETTPTTDEGTPEQQSPALDATPLIDESSVESAPVADDPGISTTDQFEPDDLDISTTDQIESDDLDISTAEQIESDDLDISTTDQIESDDLDISTSDTVEADELILEATTLPDESPLDTLEEVSLVPRVSPVSDSPLPEGEGLGVRAESGNPVTDPENVGVRAIPTVPFEDLTIAEALSSFWRSPFKKLGAIWAVAREPKEAPAKPALAYAGVAGSAAGSRSRVVPRRVVVPRSATVPPSDVILEAEPRAARGLEIMQLVIRLIAFAFAWGGSVIMVTSATRSEEDGLNAGIWLLFIGFGIWLFSEVLEIAAFPAEGGRRLFRPVLIPPSTEATARLDMLAILERGVLLAGAFALAAVSVTSNTNNDFTTGGMLAWVGSIILIVWALAPLDWSPLVWLGDVAKSLRPRFSWSTVILIGLMIFAAYFRLTDLSLAPREMTSDHVEMLIDTGRVLSGESDVFFAGNGGREAAQFYALALFSQLPGQGVNFDTLKLLNIIEGILTIPLIYFMAREVIGREEKTLATLVGLAAAALVTVSYWHEVISRLGERIVLMPLFTALFIYYFTRALRYRRRMDFLYTGLALGFGLYTYQAFRMIPLAVLAGGIIALLFNLRNGKALRELVFSVAALGIVAFVIYLPLFNYSLQYPDDYWRRTSGRLFGDEITQTTDDAGNLVARQATIEERLTAFGQNVPALLSNIRNAVLMYNWKGDVAWFNNAPNDPAFDPISGGLLVVGVAAWIGRMVRRKDPMTWLLPIFFLIMLMPSALSIAYPIENPSATRMSGTLPIVYLVTGLSLALLARGIARSIGGKVGIAAAGIASLILVLGSYANNQYRYFVSYANNYVLSVPPYSDIGAVLRDFAENRGGYGNAFIINFPYWWDHRAIGLEAGRNDYPNGVPALDQLIPYMQTNVTRADQYRLDPNHDLAFFYSPLDQATQEWLQRAFPQGSWLEMTTYQPEDTYRLYTVPALGEAGLTEFFAQMTASQG